MSLEVAVFIAAVIAAAVGASLLLARLIRHNLGIHIFVPALIAVSFCLYCLAHSDSGSGRGNWTLLGAFGAWIYASVPVLINSVTVPLVLRHEKKWHYAGILWGLWGMAGATWAYASYLA